MLTYIVLVFLYSNSASDIDRTLVEWFKNELIGASGLSLFIHRTEK